MDRLKTCNNLIGYLKRKRGNLLVQSEIERDFADSLSEVIPLINRFIEHGVLKKVEKKRLLFPPDLDLAAGRLSLHRNGFGFVCPLSGNDVFIPPRFVGDAMDGDTVLAGVLKRRNRSEGWIIEIIKRNSKRLVVRCNSNDGSLTGIPLNEKANFEVFIQKDKSLKLNDGQILLVELKNFPRRNQQASANVVKILGEENNYETDINIVLNKYNIIQEFQKDAINDSERIPEVISEGDLSGRVDLRKLPIVTIDGEDAKDFDDAVYVEPSSKNNMRLLVSIADVSHYVQEGSSLDRDALARGTSTYLPERAIPMLPEKLSNNLASLKPGVDRLTLTADLLINSSGVVIQSKLYPSVIRSAERMTYTKVWDILQGDRKLTEKYGHLVEMFRNMLTLRNRLFQRREKRGSLIFELPEPYVLMDNNGVPVDIQRRNRNPAHMIIEEFMLAANEAVAVFLEKAGIPLLFRNHEPPNVSDMRELQRFLGRFGYSLRLNGKANPLDIQSILNKCRGKPEEFIMNTVILRSMKQARYSPKNTGHFGLASGSYCHFTSPIRRYPDLIVHRILKSYLSGLLTKEKINKLRDELEYIGELSSERERVANEAEREIVDRLSARFMMDKIGEEYDGRITMVKEFGIFVELLNHFVEGMIPVEALTDDHYRYDENSFILRGMRRKSVFKIGEKIKVKVSRVNLDYGKIEFLPADLTGSLRKTKRT